MIKVLHYCPGFMFGGIESRLIDWYSNIDRNEIQFLVIKLNNKETDKIEELRQLGGKDYSVVPFNLKSIYKFLKTNAEIIKTERPNIIHAHNTETGFFILLLARLYGVETRILHARNTGFPDASQKIVRYILHILSPIYATDYWACSKEAALWGFGKLRARKSVIINNGINLNHYVANDSLRRIMRENYGVSEKNVIGTVGRFAYAKNLMFLLDVFAEICKMDSNTVLMLVGDGEQKKELEKACTNKGIANRVIFVGMVNDVWNYYRVFDVFVGTSLLEGFGTTAIEAQASGLPTVISSGFPETTVVAPYAKRLELSLGVEKWADEIKKSMNNSRSNEGIKYVKTAGFDAKDVSDYIENFYRQHS